MTDNTKAALGAQIDVHVVLTIAQTLAMGVPPPVGVIAMAGFQLLDMLRTPELGPDQTKILLDRMTQVTTDIKNLITTQKLDKVTADLGTIADWYQTAKKLVTDEDQDVDVRLKNYKNAITSLDSITLLNNFIELDLETLVAIRGSGDAAYSIDCAGVEIYLELLMGYILLLKLSCEYSNEIVNIACHGDRGAPKDLVDNVFVAIRVLWDKVNQWTTDRNLTRLNDWRAQIKKARLDLISEVLTDNKDTPGGAPISRTYATDYFLDPKDDLSKRIFSKTHTSEQVYEFTVRGQKVYKTVFTSYKNEVIAERNRYIKALTEQIEIDFAYVDKTILAIRKKATEVEADPVGAPSRPPEIGTQNTNWSGAWKHPANLMLSYGISFQNRTQQSETKWSKEIKSPAPGSICPSVTLPLAPKEATVTARKVYRKLRDPASEEEVKVLLCETLEDKTMTELVDIDPTNWDQACPNAIAVPLIWKWQRKFKTTDTPDADAPSWIPGCGVRYRYVYTNSAGNQSLSRSPWSRPSDTTTVGDIDPEGYCTDKHGGGYLAELRISKRAGATGVKVFRQFKGKPEEEIYTKPVEDRRNFELLDRDLSDSIVGEWALEGADPTKTDPPNLWNFATITRVDDDTLKWENRARRAWSLKTTGNPNELAVVGSPYPEDKIVTVVRDKVIGLQYRGGTFRRKA